MARSSPISMTFPPFAGMVRRIVLANISVFFGALVLHWVAPAITEQIIAHLLLEPLALLRGELWQVVTYSFLNTGILDILFGMMTLWFTGSLLEGVYGAQWVGELYFSSAIGGALLSSAITFTHVLGLRPDMATAGAWAGIFGLLIAIAMRFGDQEFLLFFFIRIKAKYMVAIYILISTAVVLKGNAFGALLQLAGAFCGFLYVQFAPRRGIAFGFSERYFGIRNDYYRWKRRRAARKFEVYMGKQGREVHFDKDGRYIDPDQLKKNPKDKSWMN